MRRSVPVFVLIALLAVGAALVVSFSHDQADRESVIAAFVPAGYYLPFQIIQEEGLLEKRGYRLALKRYNDNSHMISLFINGHLDVTAQSALTMFPIENEHPGRFTFVTGQYANSYYFLTASESDIDSLKNVNGKRIGTWKSPTAEAFIRLAMRNRGIRDDAYEIVRYGATEWAPAIENGLVPIVFGFDLPLARLVNSSRFRYVDEQALDDLLDGQPLFNGGAFISRDLRRRDPKKASAIRSALFEAIELADTRPGVRYRVLAKALGASREDAARARLDRFAKPDRAMVSSAQATLDFMVAEGLAESFDVSDMFWLQD